MTQFPLPLDFSRETQPGLIITDANRVVVQQVDHWPQWPFLSGLLIGPPRSGKSGFGAYFGQVSAGRLVDDADQMAEEELFHRWNEARIDSVPILMTAASPPGEWRILLPDLRSRLAASLLLRVPLPDPELLRRLLAKHLHRLGAIITPDALDFCATHMPRSYQFAESFAKMLDDESRARKLSITRPLAQSVLLAAQRRTIAD